MKSFLSVIMDAAEDTEERQNRLGAIDSTLDALRNGWNVTGWPKLGECLGRDVVRVVLQ